MSLLHFSKSAACSSLAAVSRPSSAFCLLDLLPELGEVFLRFLPRPEKVPMAAWEWMPRAALAASAPPAAPRPLA
ncbi:MAG: hypothetical protein IPK32_23880 [Verrucomicrobiaceae bacterium]|nr:hypothetical protein [Verrucomicrobiaceae bacterium]